MPIVYYFIGFDGCYIHGPSESNKLFGENFHTLLSGIHNNLVRFDSLCEATDYLERNRANYDNGDKLDVYRAEITVAHTLGVRV